ncbi:MAG: sporulation protein YqfD [Bacillota bacterium]
MVKNIFRYWMGYLEVEITGNALARFINQMNDVDINIWNLKRIRHDYYRACIYKSDFNKLRAILRKRKCHVKILNKYGFPFLLLKVRRRFFLLIGIIIFLAIFYFGSSFLWFYKFEGLDNISADEIKMILEEEGISRGILKKEVDTDFIENIIKQKINRIAWINVEWHGTQLYFDIVEKKLYDKSSGGNIISTRDGVITELIVLKGQAAVREGDTVNKGQVLIVSNNGNETARGIVKANVWYDAYGEGILYKERILSTGRLRTYWGFRIGSYSFWLSNINSPFREYKRRLEIKKIRLWRNIIFPLELLKEEHYEIVLLKEKKNEQLALHSARQDAMRKILKMLGDNTVIEEVLIKKIDTGNDQKVRIRLLMRTEERITAPGHDEGGF